MARGVTFDKLSDTMKQEALTAVRRHIFEDTDWAEAVIEDAKEVAAILGIGIKDIWWSGFSSQGDGACFEGSYAYAKGSAKAIKEYAPLDQELHRIAEKLRELQMPHFYQLIASVKHSGHYYHANCTTVNVEHAEGRDVDDDTVMGVIDTLRDFMKWIYRQLEKENDYYEDDDNLADYIKESDYKFDPEDGSLVWG